MLLAKLLAEARQVVFDINTSSATWAVMAMAGLATLLAPHPWLASTVRLLGAVYLVWYGGRLLLAATAPAPVCKSDATSCSTGDTPLCGYRSGLLTGVTNPKSAAFLSSVCAAAIPAHAPARLCAGAALLFATMSLGWHLRLTVLFATRPLCRAGLRLERLVKDMAGDVLVGLGLHRIVAR